MRDWALVNLFLLGITVTAAMLFLLMASLITTLHLTVGAEHSLVGCAAVATLPLTYYLWRAIWRRMQRRI